MEIKGISDRLKVKDGRVEVRGGGGCLPIVGVPLLLMGCAPIVALIFGQFSIAAPFECVLVGILCLIFIPIYIGVHLFLPAVAEHYTLRVSRDRLHVTPRGLLLSRVAEIPAGELEELSITKPDADAQSWEKRGGVNSWAPGRSARSAGTVVPSCKDSNGP